MRTRNILTQLFRRVIRYFSVSLKQRRDRGALFKAGLAQATDDVIDRSTVVEQPLEIAFDEGQVRVEALQLGERGLRILYSAEFGQTRNNIAQTGVPVAVQRPGASTDLDSLFIVPHLVVRPGECGKPDEHARIAGAEADAPFRLLDRLFRPTGVEVHLSEQDVSGGKARVELDRLLECRDPALGTARPHARQTKSKMGIGITRIEGYGLTRKIVTVFERGVRI